MTEIHWFLTVDWCKQGKRGLFISSRGKGIWEEHEQKQEEIFDAMDMFYLILAPESLPFVESEIVGLTGEWFPLEEYRNHWGYMPLAPELLATVRARKDELLKEAE